MQGVLVLILLQFHNRLAPQHGLLNASSSFWTMWRRLPFYLHRDFYLLIEKKKKKDCALGSQWKLIILVRAGFPSRMFSLYKRSLKLVLIIVSSFYHGMPFLTRYALVTRFPLPCRKGGAVDFMSLGNCSVLRYSNCQIVMRTAWMYQVSEVRERRPLQSLRYSKQVNSTLPHCAQVAALPNSFFRCQF